MNHAKAQAKNRQSGHSLQSPGNEMNVTPGVGPTVQLYWREILHMDYYHKIDNVQYNYRVVFDSNFNLMSVEAVTQSGSQMGRVLNCQ